MSDGRFVKYRELGQGAFGTVYLIQDKSDLQFYALKEVDLGKCSSSEKRKALEEAEIMKELQHNHVVQIFSSYIQEGQLCIITEYCEGGDLAQFLEDSQEVLPEELIVCWVWQMASALEHMHSKDILHRDLKPQNIYLTKNADIKLGDLGIARVMDQGTDLLSTMAGTPCYMSPEIFSMKGYNSKTDIWSFGCVVYEIAAKERAYDAPVLQFLVFQVVSGKTPSVPDNFSTDLQRLVGLMLSKDVDNRPTATEIMSTPPVKEYARTMKSARAIIKSSGYKTLWGTDTSMVQKAANTRAERSPEPIKIPLDSLPLARKRLGIEASPEKKAATPKGKGVPSELQTILAGKGAKKDKMVKKVPTFSSSTSDTSGILQRFVSLTMDTVKENATVRGSEQDTITPGAPITKENQGQFLMNQIVLLQQYCAQGIGMGTLQQAYRVMSHVGHAGQLKKELESLLGKDNFKVYGEKIMFLRLFELAVDKAQSGATSD
ncbi:serine/threonine-protein kinase Nek6-like [Gigantopelta aegis]|uniref:serine/threonine-protein kinase Nek6-like n=1 Tax=Gigantopelta aegis TaxID=1735272 RepID=UPI001B889FBC|nr:serine/threonine-protein kinase Nek6-like [Gigantopelta aegis]